MGSFLYNKTMNENKIVSGQSEIFRTFGSAPTIRSGRGKIVFSPSQLNKLLQSSLAVLDKIPDDNLRNALQADLRHEFEVFYGRKNLNLEARDFLIDENAEIHSDTITLDTVDS